MVKASMNASSIGPWSPCRLWSPFKVPVFHLPFSLMKLRPLPGLLAVDGGTVTRSSVKAAMLRVLRSFRVPSTSARS